MSEDVKTLQVATPPPPDVKIPKEKLDLSELSPARRAYIQELRAQVMIQRGIREHCNWLAQTGGLPVFKDDSGQRVQMSAGAAAIAIGIGTELGFPMTVALTKITMINNRPEVYGDVALALIRRRGLVDQKKGGGFKTWFTGAPGSDQYTAHCCAKRSDTGEEMETTFSVADAKMAGLWGSRTWVKWGALRMLRYRALGFLCRDLFSDVLLGSHLAEELVEEDNIGPTPPAPPAQPMHDSPVEPPNDPLWAAPPDVVDADAVPPVEVPPDAPPPNLDVQEPEEPSREPGDDDVDDQDDVGEPDKQRLAPLPGVTKPAPAPAIRPATSTVTKVTQIP